MKKILFLVLTVINVSLCFPQNSGVVLDSDSVPINGVDVYLIDQEVLLKTNKDGIFEIDGNIPDNILISFSKIGYSSRIIKFNNQSKFIVMLYSTHVELDEVGITQKYNILGNNKLINIENKSLRSDVLVTTSMGENICQLSGIDLISSGPGIQKFVVRGLSGMRVATYLNGMRIENQQWANDHGIGFTDLGLSEVELIKGSSALKYGAEAVGGILYFKDNPFINSDGSGFISSKFDNSNYLFGNKGGFTYSINNYFLNIHAQNQISSDYRLPNNTYLFNSRFRHQAFKISIAHNHNHWRNVLRYQFNAEQKGIPAHAHGDPSTVQIEDVTSSNLSLSDDFYLTRPTQIVDNHLLIYESDYFLSNHKFSVLLGQYINRFKEYEAWTYPAFDMTLSTRSLTTSLRTLLNKFTLNYGVQISSMNNKNNDTYETLIPDVSVFDYGLYSTVDYERDNIGFSFGIRVDNKNTTCDQEQYDKSFPTLNSSVGMYVINNNHTLRMTYASAFRSPHVSELFSEGVHHGTNRYELGNDKLGIERSHQFDIKYHGANDHFGIVINPFLQNISDFISIHPTGTLYENTYRIYNYVQFSKVILSGIEMNLHYHPHLIHNLHIDQSYTFINTNNVDNNSSLSLTPSNKIKTSIVLDLDKYNLLMNFRNLSLYHLYSFTQDNVVENETVTDSYNLLNLSLSCNLSKKMDVVFGIDNLLNTEYVPHLSRVKEVGPGIPNPGRSFNINLEYDF